ncbi:MAG TPA: DUF58 domain-containing protein [Syntrophales bacterium]|nr:DUF58 domain-containing protein [Syntrophales bacterium]
MLSDEQLKKIQKFHFRTRKLASDLFAGQYESAFAGQGLEFAEVREYQVGDDVRTIDWNVSARFGHPFVKVFHEERELTVMLLLDLSGSHLFGTRKRFKREILAEVAGMLAFLAIRTNDKVGAILFSSKVEEYIPPKKGASHVWKLIKEIFTYEPAEMGTNIKDVLDYLNRVVKRHAVVFLISDCMDSGFEASLGIAARKHDLTVIRISDPAEESLPDVGMAYLRDPETGQLVLLNTRSRALKEKWSNVRKEQRADLTHLLNRSGVDLVEITTDGSVSEPLIRLFEQRRRRR